MSVLRTAYAWLLLAALLAGLLVKLCCFRLLVRSPVRRQAQARSATEQTVSRYLSWTPLYQIHIHGRERLPKEAAFVLIANHQSGLDGALLLMLGTGAQLVATDWLWRTPLLGWMLRQCAHIPVQRRDHYRSATLEQMLAALSTGVPIALFPEGAYADAILHPLRSGAFVAAQQAGVAIVPVRIEGSGAAWRPGSWIVHGRHRLALKILEPLTAETVSTAQIHQLREQTAALLSAPLAQGPITPSRNVTGENPQP